MPLQAHKYNDADRRRAASEEARERQRRSRRATNALTLLKHRIATSKVLSPEIQTHALRLLEDVKKRLGRIDWLDQEVASHEAHRIATKLNWLHAEEKLLHMDPSDKSFLLVSKAAAQWTALDAKLNQRKKGQGDRPTLKKVPAAAPSPREDAVHEG
jgi:hypothetical protein